MAERGELDKVKQTIEEEEGEGERNKKLKI